MDRKVLDDICSKLHILEDCVKALAHYTLDELAELYLTPAVDAQTHLHTNAIVAHVAKLRHPMDIIDIAADNDRMKTSETTMSIRGDRIITKSNPTISERVVRAYSLEIIQKMIKPCMFKGGYTQAIYILLTVLSERGSRITADVSKRIYEIVHVLKSKPDQVEFIEQLFKLGDEILSHGTICGKQITYEAVGTLGDTALVNRYLDDSSPGQSNDTLCERLYDVLESDNFNCAILIGDIVKCIHISSDPRVSVVYLRRTPRFH